MVSEFPGRLLDSVQRPSYGYGKGGACLGLIMCVTVKTTPRSMHMPPTTTYAIPRKGFLPPITVRVEMIIDFVPWNWSTGKTVYPAVSQGPVIKR